MGNVIGTSFATAGFSYDANISPNNQSFSGAVLAVTNRNPAGLPGTGTFINLTVTGTATVNALQVTTAAVTVETVGTATITNLYGSTATFAQLISTSIGVTPITVTSIATGSQGAILIQAGTAANAGGTAPVGITVIGTGTSVFGLVVQNSGTISNAFAAISIMGSGAILNNSDFELYQQLGTAAIYNGGTGPLQFYTGGGRLAMILGGTGNVAAVQINGPSASYAVFVAAGGTTGTRYGLLVAAGSNSSDAAMLVNNAADSVNYFEIRGDGVTGLFSMPTTATAANVNVATSGYQILTRSTSSLRYKTNVQSIGALDINAILQMRPVTFNSICALDDPATTHLGFIAEEMALIDPRLVTYLPATMQLQNKVVSAVGTATIPDSVQYDRITTLLVGAVQALAQRVAALERASAPLSVTGSHTITGTATAAPSVMTMLPPATVGTATLTGPAV